MRSKLTCAGPCGVLWARTWVTMSLWLIHAVAAGQVPPAAVGRSMGGMVVSASPWATRIGCDVLREGGNAVDAAVATAFALAVTWPEAGNLGGGGFMLVCPVDRQPVVIDYREAAPLQAHTRMFQPGDSRFAHKAVATPGTVKGLAAAHARFGRLPWRRLVEPAAALAREGFAIDGPLAESLNGILCDSAVKQSETFAELRRVYGKPDGSCWQPGDRMTLPELAATLDLIAREGEQAFYRGAIAQRIVAEMQAGQGLITREDLSSYEVFMRTPVRATYRNYTVYAPPPPSSGGTCLAMMLAVLEKFQLRQYDRYSATTLHVMAEAMRRSYRERARWLGDPSFAALPADLLAPATLERLAHSIDLHHATPSEAIAGDIPLADESPETTHFSIIDSDGMAVANTYTLEASYGSRVVVRGAGFLLNNEMGDFNWFPGRTDRSGTIGTVANQVAPAKRMLSSQTPTIVVYQGRPLLITGSPGGRTIINTVLNILLNVLEYEMDLPTAIAQPRIHHQWFPDELIVEDSPLVSSETIARLQQMGHRVTVRPARQGSAHSIWIDPRTGERVGVADGRRGGAAQGTD